LSDFSLLMWQTHPDQSRHILHNVITTSPEQHLIQEPSLCEQSALEHRNSVHYPKDNF